MIQKLTTAFVLFFTFCFTASAQLKSSITSIRPQLEEVIKEFPNHFSGIRGAVTDDQQTEFESKVFIKDALETKLIAFSNQKIKSWVWECRLFETDDLDKLKHQYKSYYNDIAGKSLPGKPTLYSLEPITDYTNPNGALRLCSNQFRMSSASDLYKHLVVDLVAEYINFQWTVYLRVFDKEKDEEIRPTEKNIQN